MATYYIPSAAGWQANGGGTYSSRLRVRIDTAYNVSTNMTTATARLEAYNDTFGWVWTILSGGWIKGNGQTLYTFETATAARSHRYTSNADTTFRQITSSSNPSEWSWTIPHSDNGIATLSVEVRVDLYHYTSSREYFSYFHNLSGTVTLSEPRASDVSATGGYFGDTIPITVTRKSTAFTHNVQVACLGQTTTIATGSTASSLSWTPAVPTYAPLLTNGMSTTATITCATYNGSTLIGTKTATITMQLKAADVAPSLSLTIEDATTAPGQSQSCLDYYGAFVATKSKIKVTTVPTLAYGASVSTTSITANGATYNSSPATTDPIVSAAMDAVSGRIVDSRQQSATASETISILAYDMPQIIAMSAHRCQQDGTLDDGGAYCRFDFSISVTPLNNHNSRTLKAGIKLLSAQNYTEYPVTLSDYSETGYTVVPADTEVSHDVRLALSDDFSTTIVTSQLSSAYVRPLNFRAGGLGIGIGKVSEYDKTVDLAADWTLLKNGQPVPLSEFYNDIFPEQYSVGDIYISTNSTSPAARFGGTWEQIKDTFLLAAGDSYTAGATGGASTHSHSAGSLAARISNIDNATYGFGLERVVVDGYNANIVQSTQYAGGWAAASTATTFGAKVVGTTDGSSNMPPYLAVYVWKRIA